MRPSRTNRNPAAVAKSLFAVSLLVASGCSGDLFAPTGPPYEVTGIVWDDAQFLPDPTGVNLTGVGNRLAGARVEVMNGPRAGTVSETDAQGNYRLPGMTGDALILRVSKAGFDSPPDRSFTPTGAFGGTIGPGLFLGAVPHVFWGDVFPGPTRTTGIADVRVEILDGPNAGKVTFTGPTGRYRFDDLAASPPFRVRWAKPGHTDANATISGSTCGPVTAACPFTHSESRQVMLPPASQ